MKKGFTSSVCILTFIVFVVFADPPAGEGYVLKWSDEFDSTALDTNNWGFDVGAGNGTDALEHQYYTNGLNLTFENDAAVLWAKKEDFSNCHYTSCFLSTQGKKEFQYGYIEARLKAPQGQGIWAMFYTFGSDFWRIGWPGCGEMDMFNTFTDAATSGIAYVDSSFLGACDFQSASGGATYNNWKYQCPEMLSLQYHLYAIEWDSLGVKYFFDDNKFWEYDSINQPNNFQSFHQPHFLNAKMAVYGGCYNGSCTIDTTIFPQKMYIDYVRVYQKSTQVNVNPPKQMLKSMTLANSSQAQLKVYNLQGRLIADYTDVRRLKPSENVMKGIPSDLPIGVYVTRLFDGMKTVTEKLVVPK